MTYDEMMKLDEEKLEFLGVTKGARKKLVQSIEKLCERVPLLLKMEKVVDSFLTEVSVLEVSAVRGEFCLFFLFSALRKVLISAISLV